MAVICPAFASLRMGFLVFLYMYTTRIVSFYGRCMRLSYLESSGV